MILFVGDVHGEFKGLVVKLVRTYVRNSHLIQVGDFGVGFKAKQTETDELEVLNNFLETTGNKLYVIRGNHDNPKYFKTPSEFSNIIFLEDYSILEIEGLTILLAGGAISIDRMARVLDVSYWPGEAFGYDEAIVKKKIGGLKKIDIVVTHNAPEQFHPVELSDIVVSYALRDQPLLGEIRKERYKHTQLMDLLIRKKLKPKFWYYGHFHMSYAATFKGIQYQVLDCSEFYEHGREIILVNVHLEKAFSLAEKSEVQFDEVPKELQKDLDNFLVGSTVGKNEKGILIYGWDYRAWLRKLQVKGLDY
jgi:DNA repair exonuclease SbcCD nuclease subunit